MKISRSALAAVSWVAAGLAWYFGDQFESTTGANALRLIGAAQKQTSVANKVGYGRLVIIGKGERTTQETAEKEIRSMGLCPLTIIGNCNTCAKGDKLSSILVPY